MYMLWHAHKVKGNFWEAVMVKFQHSETLISVNQMYNRKLKTIWCMPLLKKIFVGLQT
jgi:hypothetical protein